MIKRLIHITNRKIILPFYHTVSNTPLHFIGNLYAVRDVKTFERDLDFFSRFYEPVSINQLYEIVQKGKFIRKPVFHISFDDGLKEFYSIVAPILKRKGIPATVFVNNNFIDNKDLFYRYKIGLIVKELNSIQNKTLLDELGKILSVSFIDNNHLEKVLLSMTYKDIQKIEDIAKIIGLDFKEYLKNNKPYLSSNEIKDLIKQGFAIGSHSLDHPFFKHIKSKQQQDQIVKSFNDLEERFNIQERYFSFPFGDERVNAELLSWLHKQENCKLSFGISGLKEDISRFHMHRIPMEKSLKIARSIIRHQYVYFIMKSFLGKNKVKRK
ncbi:MAG: polysaccharide deacetylase family protein [Bacteroidetes bacterium]|nr:polysaccharide deacetylase family protein [Bacteroidota bacterium]